MTTPSSGPPRSSDAMTPLTTALSATIDAAHAGVYGYQTVVAYLSGQERQQATERAAWLRTLIEDATTLLTRDGGTAPASAPGYTFPTPITNVESARALAGDIERDITQAAVQVVRVLPAMKRAQAVAWVSEAARAATAWNEKAEAFPGFPALNQPNPG
ncbi:MAG: DUF4439 domain-containing protein [Actinomycetota bacterium]